MTTEDKEDPKAHSKPYEEYGEKTGYPVKKKSRKKFKLKSIKLSEVPWAWVCVACLLFVLLLVITYPVVQQTEKTQTILTLEKRIAGLERRLDMDQGASLLLKRMKSMESGIQDLQQRLTRQEKLLSQRLEQTGPVDSAIEEEPIPQKPQKPTTGSASPRYHEVQPGETLFRIGRRYGVSVDDLREFNELAEDGLIHPGQKLMVSPP